MAKQSIITSKGLELLATSSKASGQYYWLGYYSLAYVPNAWKSDQAELPDCAPDGFTLENLPKDKISYSMQQLTQHGDIIYNVFQGDLLGTGYYRGSDSSAGGNLFGLSMYDQNIKKHYRYQLDTNNNNQLVAWERKDRSESFGMMTGKAKYKGTDGYFISELPIPAPLYYFGRSGGNLSNSDFFPEILNEEFSGSSIYLSRIYKYGQDLPMKFPLVSADYRGYLDSNGADETASYAHKTTGDQFDSYEIAAAVIPGGDNRSWFSSYSTEVTDIGEKTNRFCDTLWKAISVSNYNRYHAPTNAFGHTLDSDLASRNMATTTKFFPISNYKVINTATGFTVNNELREVATSLALTIDIDLAPSVKNGGFGESSFNYDENNNLTFFDKYSENTGDFAKTSTSFKFNRIGIYAVALNESPYTVRRTDDSELPGTVCDVQFSINPDVEPVLFAVVDFDTTIYISDTGNGLHKFRGDIQLNLDANGTNALAFDSQLCRDSVIFYNMYQDDAQTWYQNQLIATASTQNAIMEIGLELNNLKSRLSNVECCQNPNLDDRYAAKNHTHGNSLRNLVDSTIAINGGLRGIDTVTEGVNSSYFENSPYFVGQDSVVLGTQTFSTAPTSFIMGLNSGIFAGTSDNSILGGIYKNDSAYNNISSNSSILGGDSCIIYSNKFSSIIASSNSEISDTASSTYGAAYNAIGTSKNVLINKSKNTSVANSLDVTIKNAEYTTVHGSANIDVNNSKSLSILNSKMVTISNTETATISSVISSNISYVSDTEISGENHSISYVYNSNIRSNQATIANSSYISLNASFNDTVTNSNFISSLSADSNTIVNSRHVLSTGYSNQLENIDYGIVSGYANTAFSSATNRGQNILIFGDHNTLSSDAPMPLSNTMVMGSYLIIHKTVDALILSSSKCYIDGNASLNSIRNSILSSYGSYITDRANSASIISSKNSKISNSAFNAFILGGSSNSLYCVENSGILAGDQNKVFTNTSDQWLPANNAVVLGGVGAIATYYGEITHSNSGFIAPNKYDSKNELLKVAIRSNVDDSLHKFIGGTDSEPGYTNMYANTKHSIVMLSGIWDTWVGSLSTSGGSIPGRVDDVGGVITNDELISMPSNKKWFTQKFLSLDGKNEKMATEDNLSWVMESNQISIEKGESISGTVKFMIHSSHVPIAGCSDSSTYIRSNTGVVYYSLHSFGAHRDYNGKIIISDQLINESTASHGQVSVDRYGLSTIIRPWAEILGDPANTHDGNTSNGFKQTKTDSVENGEYTKTYRAGLEDNQPDRINGGGTNSGVILFSIDMYINTNAFVEMYASRVLYCTAVVDFISTKSITPNAKQNETI